MVGQTEVHWTEEYQLGKKTRHRKHCEVFDPGKEDAANRKFDELKNSGNRHIFDIRLVKVERFASVGG